MLVLHFNLNVILARVIEMSLLCISGIGNGYIKSDHEEALYSTPENVGNCALAASTLVMSY